MSLHIAMQEKNVSFNYKLFDAENELPGAQKELLERARSVTKQAYAPYSRFRVGAAARLANGCIVTGTNQENASFPVGLCAERVLLASVSSQYPDTPIETIAISYESDHVHSDHPVAPCGMCRQSLQEYESRMKQPVQLVLSGTEGPVYVIDNANCLLPLAFTSNELI